VVEFFEVGEDVFYGEERLSQVVILPSSEAGNLDGEWTQ